MAGDSSLSFFPFLRSGLGAVSMKPPADSPDPIRRIAEVSVDLVDESDNNLHSASRTFTLKGPGEVLGFSPEMIARTEPKANENDHEPNYNVFVESLDPGLFWHYSLGDGSNGQLIPWIVLLVLKRDEFTVGPNNNVKLPTVLVGKKNEPLPLPDLSKAWAWAHVQLAGNVPETKEEIEDYIAEHPELVSARLACPRVLEPLTLYTGIITATYEMERLACLGMPFTITDDFAWNYLDDGPEEIPVLYRFDFQTSEPADIERLIDILRFKPVPEGVGTRNIDGSRPGFLMNESGSEIEYSNDKFLLEGALVPPGFFRTHRETIAYAGFTQDIIPRLNTSLAEANVHDDDNIDPLVSIPVYGRYYQNTERIESPDADGTWSSAQSWIHELNLDRRYRVPASMGTSLIQRNQEEFMNECWDQLGEITEANDRLRLGEAGKVISDRLKECHIDTLNDARFILMTEPFHHYYVHNNGSDQRSFKSRLKISGLPRGTVSYPFKRMVRHMVGFENENLFGPWKCAVENDRLWRKILRIIFYIIRLIIAIFTGLFRNRPKLKRLLRLLIALLYYLKIPVKNEVPRLPDDDNLLRGLFKDAFGIGLQLPDVYPLKSETIPVAPIDIKDEFRPKFDMKADLLQRLNTTIGIPWKEELTNFSPILHTPKIEYPLYRYLIDESVEVIMPGLGKIENNTVVLMEENRKFIEAVMDGSNDAMGAEARWRECSVKIGGTFFNYFWDPTISEYPPPDILDIHEWERELGMNAPGIRETDENNLVLVIKADLIRRYPETIIFALKRKEAEEWDEERNKTEWENLFNKVDNNTDIEQLPNGQMRSTDPDAPFYVFPPIYSASIGVDVLCLGFPFSLEDVEKDKQVNYHYYFIFMEHPSLPRWGYDVGDGENLDMGNRWDNLTKDHLDIDPVSGWIQVDKLKEGTTNIPDTPYTPSWGETSAAMAKIMYQKPVRIVVPSHKLLKETEEGE